MIGPNIRLTDWLSVLVRIIVGIHLSFLLTPYCAYHMAEGWRNHQMETSDSSDWFQEFHQNCWRILPTPPPPPQKKINGLIYFQIILLSLYKYYAWRVGLDRGQSYKYFYTLGQNYKLVLKPYNVLWLRKYLVKILGHYTLKYSQSNFLIEAQSAI